MIYLAMVEYVEGESVDGVYTDKRRALKHRFDRGDHNRIDVYKKNRRGDYIPAGVLNHVPQKRKGRK